MFSFPSSDHYSSPPVYTLLLLSQLFLVVVWVGVMNNLQNLKVIVIAAYLSIHRLYVACGIQACNVRSIHILLIRICKKFGCKNWAPLRCMWV